MFVLQDAVFFLFVSVFFCGEAKTKGKKTLLQHSLMRRLGSRQKHILRDFSKKRKKKAEKR